MFSKIGKTRTCLFADGKEPSGRERLKMGEKKGIGGGRFPKEGKEISSPNMAAQLEGASQGLCWALGAQNSCPLSQAASVSH